MVRSLTRADRLPQYCRDPTQPVRSGAARLDVPANSGGSLVLERVNSRVEGTSLRGPTRVVICVICPVGVLEDSACCARFGAPFREVACVEPRLAQVPVSHSPAGFTTAGHVDADTGFDSPGPSDTRPPHRQ